MGKLKEKLYYRLVEENWNIYQEYYAYVEKHRSEHHNNLQKRLWLLICLNIRYRLFRRNKKWFHSKNANSNLASISINTSQRNIDPYKYAVNLLSFDVISFDIFDTLILRQLNKPADVFQLVGQELNIPDFAKIRERAEHEARNSKAVHFHTQEVTLKEIYEKVSWYTGIDMEMGIETELKVEFDMCMANPCLQQVFEILKVAGKPIYLTSDMYLPKDRLIELLSKCGYNGYVDVLVSCDYLCNKRSSKLFIQLQKKVGENKKIIHIGDSREADVYGAQKVNISSKYYPACRELGFKHDLKRMSTLIGSAYQGIINATLYNGLENFSQYENIGFCHGGLMILGYVQWLHKTAQKNQIEYIIFVSPKGYIFKKVYDMLFSDISNQYVYCPKVAIVKSENDESIEYENNDITTLPWITEELFQKKIAIADINCAYPELVMLMKCLNNFVQKKIRICSLCQRDLENEIQYIRKEDIFSFMQETTVVNDDILGINQPEIWNIKKNGELSFEALNLSFVSMYEEFEKGVLYFVQRYVQAFQRYPSLLNIDGSDAYIPANNLPALQRSKKST